METADAPETIRLDIPASYNYLHVLGACVRAFFEGTEIGPEKNTVAYNVELAVHEACTNIIEHAYGGIPGRIEIILSLATNPSRFAVELHDKGRSFDLPEIVQPDIVEPKLNGYGLFLIYQLMDEISYVPRPGDNRWYLVKNL